MYETLKGHKIGDKYICFMLWVQHPHLKLLMWIQFSQMKKKILNLPWIYPIQGPFMCYMDGAIGNYKSIIVYASDIHEPQVETEIIWC
jgi:hypothetical protein